MAKGAINAKSYSWRELEREFTDRTKFRGAFWRKYEDLQKELNGEPQNCNRHVLIFYGEDGIGKTRLMKKIREEMRERAPHSAYAYHNFEITQDKHKVLNKIRLRLLENKEAKFTFRRFEYGYHTYATKTGESADSVETQMLRDKVLPIKALALAADVIPIEKAAWAVKLGMFVINELILPHFSQAMKEIRELRREIKEMDPEELYECLPRLFVLDMLYNMEKRTEPVVIFLDTYEALNSSFCENAKWLYDEVDGIISEIPGVLWVIANTEELNWDEGYLGENLEQHRLENFSESDTKQFLAKCGITDETYQKDYWQRTHGVPGDINKCVDEYKRAVKKGTLPPLIQSDKGERKIIEQFVERAEDSRNIYILACLHHWTDELLKELNLKDFDLSTYEETRELSFLITDDGDYHIRQADREKLVAGCPQEIRTSVGEALLNKFLPILQTKDYATQDFATALFYSVRGAILRYPNRDELLQYYKKNISDHMLTLFYEGYIRQAKPAAELLEAVASADTTDALYAAFSYLLARFATLEGDHIRALEHAKKCLAGNIYIYGDAPAPSRIAAIKILAHCYHNVGQYHEAQELYKDVIEQCSTVYGEDAEATIMARKYLNCKKRH